MKNEPSGMLLYEILLSILHFMSFVDLYIYIYIYIYIYMCGLLPSQRHNICYTVQIIFREFFFINCVYMGEFHRDL